jgi:hypothetical protein
MSGITTQTGNGATQQAPPRMRGKPARKASGAKRTRRTQAQLAAARANTPPIAAGPALALPAVKANEIRLATMVGWFGEASPSIQQRDLACLNAIYGKAA